MIQEVNKSGSGLTGDVSEIECVALTRVTQE
jgi:hypothetical protein